MNCRVVPRATKQIRTSVNNHPKSSDSERLLPRLALTGYVLGAERAILAFVAPAVQVALDHSTVDDRLRGNHAPADIKHARTPRGESAANLQVIVAV